MANPWDSIPDFNITSEKKRKPSPWEDIPDFNLHAEEEEVATPSPTLASPEQAPAVGLQAQGTSPSMFKSDAPYAAGLVGLDQEDSGFGGDIEAKKQERLEQQTSMQRLGELFWEGGKGTVRSQEMGFGVISKAIGEYIPGGDQPVLEIPGIPEAEAVMGWGTPEVTQGFIEGARRRELDPSADFVAPRNWGEGFIMAVPQILGQAATTAAGGHAAGMLMMFGQIAGNSYDQLTSEGVDENRAMAAGIVNALVQAPLEQLGMGTFSSVFKPKMAFLKRLKKVVVHMGTEGATEFLQKYPEEITSLIARNPGAEWVEHAKAIQDNLLDWTKEGLAWDLPIGMAMGAFFGGMSAIGPRGAVDPDQMPKKKGTPTEKVKQYFKENFGVEALFTPGFMIGKDESDEAAAIPKKKTTAEGATEVTPSEPAKLKKPVVEEGRKAPRPEKLAAQTPGLGEMATEAVVITKAAQKAIDTKQVDDAFMDALHETVKELTPSTAHLTAKGPKTTQPQRLVTPAMVEEAEIRARAKRVEKAIKEEGQNYKGEALVNSKTGLPFKTEAEAKVAITRMKQENPKYKNWEWEVAPASVNVNKGYGVRPVRPMKRTSAIVRNALRKDAEAKVGDIYAEVKGKAKEEQATRQEVAKIVREERTEVAPAKLEAKPTTKKAVPKLETKAKVEQKPTKLEVGSEVQTEEGPGKIIKTIGRDQFDVQITSGEYEGDIYPYGSDEFLGGKEAAQDVKAKKTTAATLEAMEKPEKQVEAKNVQEVTGSMLTDAKDGDAVRMTPEQVKKDADIILERGIELVPLPSYKDTYMVKVLGDVKFSTRLTTYKGTDQSYNVQMDEALPGNEEAMEVEEGQLRWMTDVLGPEELGVGITTPQVDGKYARGDSKTKGKDAGKTLVDNLSDDIVVDSWDGFTTVQEAYEYAQNEMEYLDPFVVEDKKGVRWTINKDGNYGNDKMDKPNLTYPNGRNTFDFQGCGRKAYYDHNRLLNLWHPNGYVADKACYGGACYAEVLIQSHGGANATIAGGVLVQGSTKDTAKMRGEIAKFVATNGVLEARKRYPKFQINWFGDEFKVQKQNEKTGKWRTTRKFNSEEEARAYLNGRTEGEYRVDVVEGKGTKVGEIVNLPGPARVTTLLGPAKGQDIRLGVDTDGSAWLTRVDVMDALLKTGLNKLSLYSSAYHKPPPKHKLSGKTIINVTVSGYHPLAETMHRLQWAREARDNGWTVILREVTADKSVFTNAEVKLYNRIHEALLKTDFLIMEQPLHKGKAKSLPGMTEFGLPGCCKGSKLNPHTCDQCEVTEGQGKKFTDFWGMEEGALKQGKLIPDKAEIESVKFEQSKKTTRPEGLEKTKGTARATGAVGAKAVVPKVVISLAGLERGDNWLEFGGTRAHADHIEIETGAKVDVYNFSIEGSEEYLSSVTDYRGMSMSNVLNTQQVDDNPDSLELLEYTTQQMHNFFSLNPNAQIIANYPSSPHHTPSPYRPGERMNKVEMQKYLEEHFEVRKVKLKTLQLSGVKSAADVFIMTKKSFTTEQVKRITAGVQTEMFSTDNKYKEVGTITTLGVGITTDLLNNKVVDFTGKKVESAEDIAVLAQVVRDPKVETFRVFYVKDGVVVHHSAVSSRLPHTTAAFIRDDSTFGLATMKKLIRDTGADSVYLLHNHPVGKPEPSGADIRGTQSFAQVFPEVKAHVIIDSGVYVSLDVNRTRRQTVEVDQSGDLPVPGLPANWKDPLLTASLPHEQLGKRAINTSDIAEIGRAIKVQKDYGVLLMLDTSARVKNIQEIPIELFKEENIEFFKDHIRKEQELVGAYDAVVYLPGRYAGDAQRARDTVSEHAESLVRDGFLADIVVAEGSIVGHLQKTPGMFFGEEEIALHGIRARTEVTEREAPTGDDIVDVAIDDMFGSEHPGLRENLKTWWRDFSFKTYFLDGLNPILDAFGGADNNNRVYKLFRMLKGVHASIEGMMKHGKLVLNKDGVLTVKTKKKGYAALVRKHGQNLRDALRWAAATRSLEIHEASKNIQAKIDQLKADGKTDAAKKLMKKSKNILEFPKVEGLMTKEEATKVLEKYGDRPETGDLSYKELFDLHDEFHQSVLDIAVDSGVISQDQRELWRDLTYVPFYRVFEDAESKAEFFQNPKAGLHIATKLDKKLKGSKKKINEPMENAIANWAYLIQESMRNRATAEAYFTAQQLKYELGSTLIDDISTEDIEGIKVKDGIVTYMTKGGEPNVMSFLLNGERKFFKVEDTALFNALTAINKEGFGKFFNVVFGGPKRVLTYTATFGPAFRVANILRDTLHTWMITPGVSFKPFLDSFHGFVKAMREDESTIRNMAAGGLHGGSYINAEDPKNLSKFTKRLVEEQTRSFGDGVLNTFRKGLDFWMKIGEAAENAARVMRFEQIQREGGDTLDAAYGSRDLLDFSMRGEGRAVNLLISMIPFLNARAQGNYRMYRGAIENPVDFAIKGAILMAASMALWAAYKDDERYKELPDHEKFTYYHWWIGEGEDGHMRMPKPFETGIIFSTMAESIGNIATGNEDLEFFSKFMQHAALETLAFNPVPQALKPIVEVYSNRNMFTGRPIETRAMQALKPGERTSTYTSETLQLIGKGLNISPKKMEALSQGYLSTMAAFLLAGPDQISRWFGNFPEKPTVRTNEFPLIGRFWRTGPARSTKEMTRFYDILTESNELVATVQHYSKMGDIGKVKKLLKENKKLYAFNPTLKRFQQNLSQIRKHMNAIYISKKSAEWKRKQLDKLTRQRNKIVKQAYDFYKGRL